MDIGYSFGQMIWIVLVYSFLGWCCEVAFAAVRRGIFVNRGFLNGPVCPIYGFGVLIVLLVLEPVKDNLAAVFRQHGAHLGAGVLHRLYHGAVLP